MSPQFGDMPAQRSWAVAVGGEGEACWRSSGRQELQKQGICHRDCSCYLFRPSTSTCNLCLSGKSQGLRVSGGCIHFLESSLKLNHDLMCIRKFIHLLHSSRRTVSNQFVPSKDCLRIRVLVWLRQSSKE